MHILIATDKFKGSLTAMQAALAMAEGVRLAVPDATVDLCPIADGGEGTVQAMSDATAGQLHTTSVLGPRLQPVDAVWAMLPDRTAVIEMASAAGLELLTEDQRDPTLTTTYGVGQLIAAALDHHARQILL